jgi:hypothetical protein
MKNKKSIATITESELKRLIRNEVIRYLKEEDEVDPQDEKDVMAAFEKAAKDMEAAFGKIGADVEKKKDDEKAVEDALKKQPALAKIATESIKRRKKALSEGKARQAVNEELTLLFVTSLALAVPAIVQLIGKIVKSISILLGGTGKAGDKLIHAGHKWHHKITSLILKGLQLIPGFKQLPSDKQEKIANTVHTVIVASLAVASGAGAIKAASQGANVMAGIEAALTAVKAGEVGVGKFLTDTISKLLA